MQITLEDVHHSPIGSRDGTDGRDARLWYGSEPVLDRWYEHLLNEVRHGEKGVIAVEEMLDKSVSVAPQ